jgi:phosphoribosylformylglycinamidine (FGAM) synthase PurS component
MATTIEFEDEVDYYNKVKVEIKVKGNIEGPDAKTIHDAINTIMQTSLKYFRKAEEK